jgi:putative transport protein
MDIHKLFLDHPELSIFLSIVIGNLLGRVKIGHFSLGNVVGTLIAGIFIGIFVIPDIPEMVRWAFFDLFLFAIGYSVGPQFFSSLRKSALPQIMITLTVNFAGLTAAILCAWLLHFDTGTSAGILSGGLTQSAALGTAISAIHELKIPEALQEKWSANVPVADAMTYIFGDVGLILMLVVVLPAMFKINLQEESKKLEEELRKNSSKLGESFFKTAHRETLRAYRLTNPDFIKLDVKGLEEKFSSGRIFVQKILRNDQFIEVTPTQKFQPNDIISLAGWRMGFVEGVNTIGEELDDDRLLSIELLERKIFISNKEIDGKTLAELAANNGRGLFLRKITRASIELPREMNLVIHRGDIVTLLGSREDLERATTHLGFQESDPNKSDLAFLSACVCIGIVFGLLQLVFHEVPIGLGSSGSILVIGLVAGWAQKRFPLVGSIPEAAQQLLIDIGLTVFIAIVGLKAGPHAVEAIRVGGVKLVLEILGAGAIVTLVGPISGFIMGRMILKQNAATVLASIGGAQTAMPSLNALQDASGSKILAMSFTLPYAIGNILLTLWGPVIVAVSQIWQ